jgi:hypothetical protein
MQTPTRDNVENLLSKEAFVTGKENVQTAFTWRNI